MTEHIIALCGLRAKISGHILQDGFFAQVVTNNLGDIAVNRLVIRDTSSRGIRESHVATSIGSHQPWYTQHTVRTKSFRVKKIIVNATINHVDSLRSAGGLHPDHVIVVDEQVGAIDQFNAHLLSKKGMLKVR